MADERNLVVGIAIILLLISTLLFGFKSFRSSQYDGTVLSILLFLGFSYSVFVVFTQNPYQREAQNFKNPTAKRVVSKNKLELTHGSQFVDEKSGESKVIKISGNNLYVNNVLKFSGLNDGYKLHVVHHKTLHSVLELDNVDYIHSIV